MTEPYHRFVFGQGGLVGDFDGMYRAEAEEGFDSWHQDDLARRPDIVNLLTVRSYESVLDVGCGKGALLAKAQANRVVGVDISPTALEVARARLPHAEFRCRNALSAADPGEQFELVMLVAILYYLDEWREVLAKAAEWGQELLVWAYVPEGTVGTIESIPILREAVGKHFTIADEIGEPGGPEWGARARRRTARE